MSKSLGTRALLSRLVEECARALSRFHTHKEPDAVIVDDLAQALHSMLEQTEPTQLPWVGVREQVKTCMDSCGWSHGTKRLAEAHEESVRILHRLLSEWISVSSRSGATDSTCKRPAEQSPRAEQADDCPVTPSGHKRRRCSSIPRVIDESFPQLQYKPRGDHELDDHVFPWGQRKLLLMEVSFLTAFARSGDTVVYAGAAPGTHIPFLASMLFPDLSFELYDPVPCEVDPRHNVQVHSGFFTDAEARKWAHRDDLLFISDVRRIQDEEDLVAEDLQSQARWHELIRPRASSLKFRLPWVDGSTFYPVGDVHLQPYAPARSSETRLFVLRDASRSHWDNRKYWEQLYRWNTVERVQTTAHSTVRQGDFSAVARDDCWDCLAEQDIWEDYISCKEPWIADVPHRVKELMLAFMQSVDPRSGKARMWKRWVSNR
jgi:hypothetical protein